MRSVPLSIRDLRPGWRGYRLAIPLIAKLRRPLLGFAGAIVLALAVWAPGARAGDVLQPANTAKPGFALADLAGDVVRLDTQRGHVVLVHFFATWCEPCREELPALRRLVERSSAMPVTVLAISVGEVDARVRRFMETVSVNFPVLLDRERTVAKSWDVYALPTTYVLDRELKPRLVSNGEFAWDHITIGELRDLMAATPGRQSRNNDNPRPREPEQGG